MITDFRNSYACGNGESTTLIVEVCIRLGVQYILSPLVGIAVVLKSFLLCMWKFVMCTSFALVIYTYYIFCGDPFFHLRAHPTQMMG